MTDEERLRRAQEAERIWNGELMREAREHIEKSLMAGFARTPMRDTEGLRWIRALFEAHKAYESFFRAAMDDGKLAKVEIDRKLSLGERLRRVI